MKEACNINKSLSVLTDVVSSLAKLKKGETQGFSRFRESKLTHFLKDSLGGSAFIMLIACISLEDQFIEDSLRTIEFAKNVKNIKVQEVKRNDSITIASNNEGLKEENASKDIEILSLKKRI